MTRGRLLQAWAALVVLTGLSTALQFAGVNAKTTGIAILAFAGLKARLVLLDYLELRGVAGWSGGILACLTALIALLMVFLLAA